MATATSMPSPAPERKLIAPVWHTALLVGIFLAITLAGALFQHKAPSTPGAPEHHPNVVLLYLSVIAAEWFLVYGVWAGIQKRGVRLADLIGGRWNSAKDVLFDLFLAIVVWILWIATSLSAGFCEEVAFRGYFQKQFEAMTGSPAAAVILQGILFGIAHGYQGLRAIIMIMLFGFLFGILALWRKSLRPGVILHAWSDIYAGYLIQFMR